MARLLLGARLIDVPDWSVIEMTQLTAVFVGTVWGRTFCHLVNLLRKGRQQQMLFLHVKLFVVANKRFY